MGSNMAECHPVGFQWVVEAQERGARGDPRRSAFHAHERARRPPRRRSGPGSDIAFLGGVVNHILENGRGFREYVVAYTNAAAHHRRGLPGHRGPRRFVLRLRRRDAHVRHELVAVRGRARSASARPARARARRRASSRDTAATAFELGDAQAPARDQTLQHPRCVFQILRRHFSRYTPERWSTDAAACRPSSFLAVAEALCANSGRERTSAIVLLGRLDAAHRGRAVHPHRGDHPAAAREHRPARRRDHGAARARHRSRARRTSRRSTTCCPGYLPMPHAQRRRQPARLRRGEHGAETGYWGRARAYLVSC